MPATVAASPLTESVDDMWKVQGKVRAVSLGDIVVETPQGQSVRVDASSLAGGSPVVAKAVSTAVRSMLASQYASIVPTSRQ